MSVLVINLLNGNYLVSLTHRLDPEIGSRGLNSGRKEGKRCVQDRSGISGEEQRR